MMPMRHLFKTQQTTITKKRVGIPCSFVILRKESMMITLNKYGNRENRVWLELYGLSTDEKPIEKFDDIFIGNSSTYYEMDTKNTFMYDEENKKWWEV